MRMTGQNPTAMGMEQQSLRGMNRSQMLSWITMLGFCVDDMLLFLDTHPMEQEALEYYEQCAKLYENAKNTYEQSFGPLTKEAAGARNGSWDWGQEPLPWEGVI